MHNLGNVLGSMNIDEKELTYFICCHSDTLDQKCILNLDQIDSIIKYFYQYRIAKVAKFCNYMNSLHPSTRRRAMEMLHDLRGYVTHEKNYSLTPSQLTMFIDPALAYTLVPVINESAIINTINYCGGG